MKVVLSLVLLAALGCECKGRFVPSGDGYVALDTKTGVQCNPNPVLKSAAARCYDLYKGTATNPDDPQANLKDQEKRGPGPNASSDLSKRDGHTENQPEVEFNTPDEFAERVKEKHPEDRDVPNDELVRRILTKYPVYWNNVNAAKFAEKGIKKPGS